MCEKANIPDNVAGATFMAAGASSPELFASIIALFLYKSALGAGTIIGSEIFNHLCICAGSVLYSKGGVVEVEPRIVMRECACNCPCIFRAWVWPLLKDTFMCVCGREREICGATGI